MDRAEIVHENFLARVSNGDLPEGKPAKTELGRGKLVELYRSQCLSRQLDRTSRAMQKAGQGFYTIGSSGHEAMAAVAEVLRPADMAFLHYRDAAFQIQRANQVPGQTIIQDMLLGFTASSEDPISGGRHKVLGSRALNIPPQTSTIASHLPKAVGAAFALGLARHHRPKYFHAPDDALVMCSFGDASANHSTAQGAFNTAGWTSYRSVPLPLLFVCEDNGIGISVRTPKGWIAASYKARPGLKYFACNGLDVLETERIARAAARYVRQRRKPAFLHIETVRLYGHAGSDVEESYRSAAEIEAGEANDPLLHSVRLMEELGVMSREAALALYLEAGALCEQMAAEVVTRPRLKTAGQIAASIVPPARSGQHGSEPSAARRAEVFGGDIRAMAEPQPMNRLINWALTDLMLEKDHIVVAGEDVGRKGGVYGITQKLLLRFGPYRVIDTLLDEQSILGLAIGLAQNGFLPLPEIQFLAYLHNAEDQIRGEAATLPFFSNGQFTNPMVLRIAGLGYQRGFGGHFHNDNSLAVLRDIPGLIIACPSNGADAAMMLRECVRLADEEQRVVVFIEPIALYPRRDFLDDGDQGWLCAYPDPSKRIALGDIGVHGDGTDVAIISYANGAYLSRQAAHDLAAKGVAARVIDLRWLAPLPVTALLREIADCKAVVIVDECRRTGSQSEALMALFAEESDQPVTRVTAEDCFVATGPAYAAPLPSRDLIMAAALKLTGRQS